MITKADNLLYPKADTKYNFINFKFWKITATAC